jgi:hypothetical protein
MSRKSEAKKYLDWVREFSKRASVEQSVEFLREHVAKARCTLKSIGISEEELNELLLIGYKSEATRWLVEARGTSMSADVGYAVRLVKQAIDKAHCTLADIGTNDEELNKLLHEGYRSGALMIFTILREGNNKEDIPNDVIRLRELLADGGYTLADIGTSEEELEKLSRQ